MKLLPKKHYMTSTDLAAEFASLPRPTMPCLTQVAGSADAKLMLISEHPTPAELAADELFASDEALALANILEQAGFNLDTDFLTVPYSRFGDKPNKASTVGSFDFIHSILPRTRVRCVVLIGMLPFAHLFAGGKKTHARSIIGNPMYLPQLHTLPVFVLPDTKDVIVEDFDNWRLRKQSEAKVAFIFSVAVKLKQFADTL